MTLLAPIHLKMKDEDEDEDEDISENVIIQKWAAWTVTVKILHQTFKLIKEVADYLSEKWMVP